MAFTITYELIMSHNPKLCAKVASLLFVLLSASGCSTIIDGFYQKVSVDSNARNAYCTVSQDGNGLVDAVVAPGKLLVRHDRFASLHVKCKRDGYKDTSMTVEPILPGDAYPDRTAAGLGSFMATFGLSALFDHSSGAGTWYPESVFVWMEKEE